MTENEYCAYCRCPIGEPITLTTSSGSETYCAMTCVSRAHRARLDALGAAVGLVPTERHPDEARAGAHMYTAGYREGKRDAETYLAGFLAGRLSSRQRGRYLPEQPTLSRARKLNASALND